MTLRIDRTLDFVTRLRTGKRSLQLLLDGITQADLERFHFADGQEVRVRVADEHLEIRPRREMDDIRHGLGNLAFQLRDMSGQLRTFLGHLAALSPASGTDDLDSAEAELSAAIECLLADEIAPAIARLEAAARLSPERSGDVR